MSQEPGIPLTVNGVPRRLRAFSLHAAGSAVLPVWTADVDGSLGCAGTLEDAILMAARAADNGVASEMEVKS